MPKRPRTRSTAATCLVCLDRCPPVGLPCCGVDGADMDMCQPCVDRMFGTGPAKCPKCREWLAQSPAGLAKTTARPARPPRLLGFVVSQLPRADDQLPPELEGLFGTLPPEFVQGAMAVGRMIRSDGDEAGFRLARRIAETDGPIAAPSVVSTLVRFMEVMRDTRH